MQHPLASVGHRAVESLGNGFALASISFFMHSIERCNPNLLCRGLQPASTVCLCPSLIATKTRSLLTARNICLDSRFSFSTCVIEVVRGLQAVCCSAGKLEHWPEGDILENAWNTAELPFIGALVEQSLVGNMANSYPGGPL